jgi:hypothetical protein
MPAVTRDALLPFEGVRSDERTVGQMTDRELSTRDLAEASDRGAEERETERTAPDRDRVKDTAPADEPLARDRSELDDEPVGDGTSTAEEGSATAEPLLPENEAEGFTTRWREIQIAFVDEPRDSVAKADALVADLMQRLATSFSDERQRLEGQWDRGDDVSTEDLRVTLTRYRSFFDRLLSA